MERTLKVNEVLLLSRDGGKASSIARSQRARPTVLAKLEHHKSCCLTVRMLTAREVAVFRRPGCDSITISYTRIPRDNHALCPAKQGYIPRTLAVEACEPCTSRLNRWIFLVAAGIVANCTNMLPPLLCTTMLAFASYAVPFSLSY